MLLKDLHGFLVSRLITYATHEKSLVGPVVDSNPPLIP
jgi:hypothetical protein